MLALLDPTWWNILCRLVLVSLLLIICPRRCLEQLKAVTPDVRLIFGDLGDILRLNRVYLNEYEYIFHMAANTYIPPSIENPSFDFHSSLLNTFILLETLRHTENKPRLANVSSAAVYGNPQFLPIRETDSTVPISPYGVNKLAAERYASIYSQIFGIRATSLRLFSVYGHRQRKQVVYDMLERLWADPTRLEVLGDGSQTRDFTYVLDVIQFMVLVATSSSVNSEVYDVWSGITHSITELVNALCGVCGLALEVSYTSQVQLGDAQKRVVNISSVEQLGVKPQTTLEIGLTAIRDWYDKRA